ncbi:tRNA uridine-5-carboxymethylaminomethyl(34) synthesis GTPase MnmE [Rhodoferax aquaticus]|uniref:tRNA modification GTPase MnmE n=1 Tax=Rhodoferax aquaticus TaxID=2527691 RepID=A0A515EV69_9BURK|nr:tRNA uridine-5-carboxymethylaminomethyl(34) synthesis GTPase MnmE [Rhodoferax aquaticus]QDL56580.1 tRNA uridine-5-carboxymethylaminomethyl(34) synthesis GTPase MnmE [Rhodoferax aquaticus]
MLSKHHDPVIAIATAPGRGSVGIVRISGPNVREFAQALAQKTLQPREATYLAFRDAQGVPIDHGLLIFFPGPHSYTGEDVLELQAHGGPIVLQLLVARCFELAQDCRPPRQQPLLPSLRMAQAGEFTQRAFLNDKLDLAQAEAIADLIDASTEAAARSASQSLSGVFSKEVVVLKDALVHLRMLVEATLDFPEEEIDFLKKADAEGQVVRLSQSLSQLTQRAQQGALLREGLTVVIAGQPNAGKSSLLNALAGAELAIVTPIAGTTRDKVQETIQIEGIPIHIVDTAGLRASEDIVEKIGIARTWDAIGAADALVFLHDISQATAAKYIAADEDIASATARILPKHVPIIHVWNKGDLMAPAPSQEGIVISAKHGQGLEALRHKLLEVAGWSAPAGGVFIARERHLQALRRVAAHLENAHLHLKAHIQTLDLMAEELRLAQLALAEITGEFTPDDLLGVIFSKFCIGK